MSDIQTGTSNSMEKLGSRLHMRSQKMIYTINTNRTNFHKSLLFHFANTYFNNIPIQLSGSENRVIGIMTTEKNKNWDSSMPYLHQKHVPIISRLEGKHHQNNPATLNNDFRTLSLRYRLFKIKLFQCLLTVLQGNSHYKLAVTFPISKTSTIN
ncbi:hypothetical protein T10_1318 [Trichinella papuae]|uniref:Uncharacterized protein n=1 Tax=Trichinella papuae TaxID=268474 RepID=A0A0V1M4H5_9BILA|nr:hypothetical protein T10_2605 [Trichinella papuae]KRZ67761.1 hypothetical protein T10_1318 [Trichinella papuae]